MHFEFAIATRIIFGQGWIKEAAPIAAAFPRVATLRRGGATADGAINRRSE